MILARKASDFPPSAAWSGFLTGKFVDVVKPVTYAAPVESTAMPPAFSQFAPPI